jgi:O-glycosyl hydrolase
MKLIPATIAFLLIPLPTKAQSKPVLVRPEIQFQRLEGFGASGGNGCAREIYSLPASERTKLLDLLFGPDGARINILRTEIWWTGNRLPLTHPLYLRGFVYYFGDEDNESAQYFLMREAQKRSEVVLNSCVWSPPPQWKTNNSVSEGGELLPNRYEDFADYLLGYLQYYKSMRNQDFQVLSIQNSPDMKLAGPSCQWSGEQLRAFVKLLGPRLKQHGFSTRIMVPEVDWDQAPGYIQPILGDPESRSLVLYLSAHSSAKPSPGRNALKELSKRQNLKLWQSEFAIASGAASGDLEDALQLASQVLEDLVQSDCHAWLYWTFLSPSRSTGRQGLLEKSGSSFKPSKKFWSFAQFSRFLPRDSVRISAEGGILPIVAFRNPEYNGITLVIINSKNEPATEDIELRGWTMERVVAYRTSEKENSTPIALAAESGPKRSLTLAPKSVTTLIAKIRRTGGE